MAFKGTVSLTGNRPIITSRVVIACIASWLSSVCVSAIAADRPNVVLIYSDDQGFGDASCLNPDSRFQTPNLDRLAREGISFTDGHCSDTVCTPSRYGLLTGRYSWRTVLKRGVFGAERECLIADGRTTIASLLKRNGYSTAMIGKWHLGMDFPGEFGNRDWSQPVKDMPLDKGFDYFYGIPASMNYGVLAWFEGRFAMTPPTLFTQKKKNKIAISDYRIAPPYDQTAKTNKKGKVPGGGNRIQRLEVAPDFVDSECLTRFTDKTVEWIDQHTASGQEKPFFVYVPFTSPHKPVIPIKQFRGKSDAGAYGDFMMETDWHVGRILDCLTRNKLDENTLVVFTSDNGPENTWPERSKRFKHQSNGEFRDGKRSVYEGGHRVPFFVRWPAGISQPGRTWDKPVCQTDLLETFAQLVGDKLAASEGEDSVSFLHVLKNEAGDARPALINHGVSGRFAIRDANWKLVMEHKKQSRELYDLSVDPGEKTNVIAQHPEIATRLEQGLSEIVLNGRTTPGEKQANDTGPWDDLTWLKAAAK